MKTVTLYQELLRKTMEENRYLKDNIEHEADKILKLETEKRVIRDKIEKITDNNNPKIEGELKEMLKKIINYILEFEKENIELYKKNMTNSIENIKIGSNDLGLKIKYNTTSNQPKIYDKKK
jgi:hypothetical protein